MTDEQRAWHQAWAKAWGTMPDIHQGRTANIGGKFSYTYAALPDIIASVRGVLSENGFGVSQSVIHLADGLLGVETRVYHEAGWVETFGPTPMAAEGDPRTIGSAITYARRYALAAALGVASDEDTDAGGTEGTGKRRQNATRDARMPQDGGKGQGKPPDPDVATKKEAVAAISKAYQGIAPEEAKRLAAKHWVEACEVAAAVPVGEDYGVVDALLVLVAADPERPM